MIYKIMTRHRFAHNGWPADTMDKPFYEQISVSNREIAEKIVDMLRCQRFTDEDGRTRYRYGWRGVKLVEVSQD
jgi:hypothetical protein